jgi:toxin HigB-1
MIKSWKHKGLKKFFETGSMAGIRPAHVRRLSLILERLEAATKPDDLDLPGMQFHNLSGQLKGCFSVTVNGNWRVIYGFKDENAVLVDYLDYH